MFSTMHASSYSPPVKLLSTESCTVFFLAWDTIRISTTMLNSLFHILSVGAPMSAVLHQSWSNNYTTFNTRRNKSIHLTV